MTSKEIETTLEKLYHLVDSMDTDHVKQLLSILITAGQQRCCTFFKYFDNKRQVKKLISTALKSKKLLYVFSKNQIRQIYEIMGDYQCYQICKLCNQPIKMDTHATKQEKQSEPLAFSWDHIYPKSLGGSSDLQNLQPSHKLCNNLKGSNVLCHEHYTINISIDINVEENPVKKHYKQLHHGLRKQDSWCHKQRCQHHR